MEGLIVFGTLVALGAAALLWGAESRDGFSGGARLTSSPHWLAGGSTGRRAGGRGTAAPAPGLPSMMDVFAAEAYGRARQEALLREAAYGRLCREAAGAGSGTVGTVATVASTRTPKLPVTLARRALARLGAALVAVGTGLQRIAVPQAAAPEVESAAW